MRHWKGITVAICALWLGGLGACGDDDGDQNQNNDNENTTTPVCGDGTVDPGESCDDGADNSDTTPDACRSDCRLPTCGDGIVDSDEQCDEGGANSDLLANACRKDCQAAGCGDGILDVGEACDDGNLEAADGCDASCIPHPWWHCEGQPSQCDCATYRSEADCSSCVVYVDVNQDGTAVPDGQAWASAYRTVQEGIDAAAATGAGGHCEVWVAAGMYKIFRDLPENTVYLAEGVALYGGFVGTETDRSQRDWKTNRTVLNGASGPPGSTVYHVVTAVGLQDAVLDGFVIVGGCANGDAVHVYGGGMLNIEASPTVANCLFTTTPEISSISCSIYGGGMYNWRSDPVITDTVFTELEAENGGAIMNEESGPLIERCIFVRNVANRGGAIYNRDSDPVIRQSVFTGNHAVIRGGAIHNGDSNPVIRASVFAGNECIDNSGVQCQGGAISNWSSDTLLANVTIHGNYGDLGGALYTAGNPGATLQNCVLWDNDGLPGYTEIAEGSSGTVSPTITYSIITNTGSDPTNHNHGQNPAFVAIQDTGLISSSANEPLDYLGTTTYILDGNHYQPGDLVGRFLRTNIALPQVMPIVANTANTVTIWGYAAFHFTGNYEVISLVPNTGSPCIDGGFGDAGALGADVAGTAYDDCNLTSTNDGGGTPDFIDRGAFEAVCP